MGLAFQLGFVSQVFAVGSYFSSGTATSSNLLSGYSASSITNFYYNLSSLPSGSSASIRFSNNGTSWYSAAGVLNASTSLSTAGGANISLSALNWSGTSFYYAITLYATGDGSGSPVVSSIQLDYNTTSGYGSMFTIKNDGHVGIGTSTPLSTLDINGGVAMGTYAGVNMAPQNGLIVSGYVGIGTTSPSNALSVTGNGYFSGSLTAMSTLSVFGITNTGSITSSATSTAAAFVATSATATSTFMGAVGIGTTTPMSILSVVGTSTFAGSLTPALDNTYSLGSSVTNRWKTVWSQTLNTGDLVFGNNFRLLEATTTDGSFATTTGAAMYWQNQFGQNIFNLDQKGNLALSGDICTSNVNCFDELASTTEAVSAQVASLSSVQDSLANTTASTTALTLKNLELGTSLANSFATMNANFGVLDTRISDIASESARWNLASATSSATTSPSSFIGRIADAVIEYIQSTATLVLSKITATLAVFTNVEMQKASISDKLCIGSTCVNEDQLKTLLRDSGVSTSTTLVATSTVPSSIPQTSVKIPVVVPSPIVSSTTTSTTSESIMLPIASSTTTEMSTTTPISVATTTLQNMPTTTPETISTPPMIASTTSELITPLEVTPPVATSTIPQSSTQETAPASTVETNAGIQASSTENL